MVQSVSIIRKIINKEMSDSNVREYGKKINNESTINIELKEGKITRRFRTKGLEGDSTKLGLVEKLNSENYVGSYGYLDLYNQKGRIYDSNKNILINISGPLKIENNNILGTAITYKMNKSKRIIPQVGSFCIYIS
jgi:beta-lactamase class A